MKSLKYPYIAILVVFLITSFDLNLSAQPRLTQAEGYTPIYQLAPTSSVEPAAAATGSTKPVYHKKVLVFKRTVTEPGDEWIRVSEILPGYQALSAIPPIIVAPFSIRTPQFLNSSALSNYQALSNLGLPANYSNANVQQFLNNLSTQQYMFELSNDLYWTNLNYQQYLNNFNSNLTYQMYQYNFNSLNNQLYLNNFNTQMYMNNWSTFSSPTFIQPIPQFQQPTYDFP